MMTLQPVLSSGKAEADRRASRTFLLVDAGDSDAERLADAFVRFSDGACWIDHVADLDGALTRLQSIQPDAVLVDLDQPDGAGLDAIDALRRLFPALPVIALGRLGEEHLFWRAAELGAEAMLPRDRLTPELLICAIDQAVKRHRQHRDLLARAEDLERTGSRFLSLVVDNADAIVALDRCGIIRFVNPAAERLLRCPSSELLGQMFGIPVEGVELTEVELRHKKDRGRIVELRVMRTHWDGDRGYIVTMRDVTDRKRSEVALRIAKQTAEQANAMKTQFLANMSHELRTPLNCIIGFSELILQGISGPVQPPRYHGYIEDVHKGATHLLTLINDLLDLAKAESGKLELVTEPFDVAALAQAVAEMMTVEADKKQIRLSAHARPRCLWLDADSRMVKQILINLVSNSIKFTPKGGNVAIAVDRTSHGEVRLTVEDNGVGIPSDQIPRAFAAFVQIENAYKRSENAGTGLGLALTKKFVELHQGRVRIDSAANRGTSVIVTFPAARTVASPIAEAEPAAMPVLRPAAKRQR